MLKDEYGQGGGVEELHARLQELQQKLEMAEQVINDKEQDICKALGDKKEDAKMDLLREKSWDEKDRVNKGKIAELQGQIKDFEGYVSVCKDGGDQGRDGATAECGDVERSLTVSGMCLKCIEELQVKLADDIS